MKTVETTIEDPVYVQLAQLAAAHTAGNIPAMMAVMLTQACMGSDYEYAVIREKRLQAALKMRKGKSRS